jgi:hypothetical protein
MTYEDRAIGLDISHYQVKVDWDKFDGDFVIIKAGEGTTPDPSCADHVQQAYDHHVPIGLYWFHDPAMFQLSGLSIDHPELWWSPEKDPQLQAMARTVSTKAYNFLALDHERWWLFNGEYIEFVQKVRAIDDVKKVTNAWNSTSAKIEAGRFQDWLIKTYPSATAPTGSTKKFIMYSAKWFIDNWSPDTRAWIDTYEQWCAEYPYNSDKIAIANLAEYKQKYLPTSSPKWMGNRDWFLWQVSGDKFTVPWILGGTGQPSAIDINISKLPKAAFLASINATPYVPPVVVPPEEPPVVIPPVEPPDDELPPVEIPTTDWSIFLEKLDRSLTAAAREWLK